MFINLYVIIKTLNVSLYIEQYFMSLYFSAYVFVATVEGNLTALDFESGRKCWSIVLDSKGFMSSTLSKLEVNIFCIVE